MSTPLWVIAGCLLFFVARALWTGFWGWAANYRQIHRYDRDWVAAAILWLANLIYRGRS